MKPEGDNLPVVPTSQPNHGKRRVPVRPMARLWVAERLLFPTHTKFWRLPPDEAARRVLCDYCGLPVVRVVKASPTGKYPTSDVGSVLLSGDRAHWWTRHPAIGQPPIHYAPIHQCPRGTYDRRQREARGRQAP